MAEMWPENNTDLSSTSALGVERYYYDLKHFRLFYLCEFVVTYTVETNTVNKAIKTIF
jgi:hypothetical protein